MSKKLYPESDIQNIANAIRNLNGSSDTYTVSQMASAIALPENAYYLKESPSANPLSITDGEEFNAQSLKVTMNPIQDLHGYDYPWVGGAGKNKIPLTVAHLKTVNTLGSWSGNSYTYNGITYTLNLDEGGNVKSVTIKGTASADSGLTIIPYGTDAFSSYLVNGSSYKINGCEGGSSSTYSILAQANGSWYRNISGDTSFTYTSGGADRIGINIANGYQCPTDGIAIYPMIRLSTETDATFAPYSNICPISGRTEANVEQCGKNVFDLGKYLTDNNITYTKDGDWFIFSIGSALYANKFTLPELSYYSGQLIIDSARTVATNVNLRTYKNGTAVTQGSTFTNQQIDQVGFNYSTTGQVCCKVQVEYGATITDFTAYNGHTYTSTFGQTVYGGKDEVLSGKLTNEWGIVDLGSLTYAYDISKYGGYFYTIYEGGVRQPLRGDIKFMASCYKQSHRLTNDTPTGSITYNSEAHGQNMLIIKDTRYTDPADLKTALNGQTMCYKLATPTEITLTPQKIELLKGQNVLSTNGDNIQLKYWSKSLN